MARFRTAGILLAVTGVAHLVTPKPFEMITKPLFPENTAAWVRRNGLTELVLGVAVAVPQTRRAGLAGFGVYSGWLGRRAVASLRG
ncbi:MAG: hypothetical protein ABIS86_09335 [Streptosporangiaceae bacterium]